MSRNRTKRKSKKPAKARPFPQWLADLGKKHNIYVFREDSGNFDFLDKNTGKSLGIWKPKPWPQYILNGFAYNGSPTDALRAIVAPYDL